MEWIHCHIARQPTPPSERLRAIPGTVSAIVLKLLAKNAEDRYQTAARSRGRPAALPGRMAIDRPHRAVRARCARRAGSAADPRAACTDADARSPSSRRVRARRGRTAAGPGARLGVFRHRQVLHRERASTGGDARHAGSSRRASSSHTNAIFLSPRSCAPSERHALDPDLERGELQRWREASSKRSAKTASLSSTWFPKSRW